MRKQKGFSLIELMLVAAIILILAAIAVPSFLRSRMAANEASAVDSLHDIETAQVAYASTYPALGFASDLNSLGPGAAGNDTATSSNALLLDAVLGCPAGVGTAGCQKNGYTFNVTAVLATPIGTYALNANPDALGQTGLRYFYSDPSGVVRYNATAIATANDQTLQ